MAKIYKWHEYIYPYALRDVPKEISVCKRLSFSERMYFVDISFYENMHFIYLHYYYYLIWWITSYSLITASTHTVSKNRGSTPNNNYNAFKIIISQLANTLTKIFESMIEYYYHS